MSTFLTVPLNRSLKLLFQRFVLFDDCCVCQNSDSKNVDPQNIYLRYNQSIEHEVDQRQQVMKLFRVNTKRYTLINNEKIEDDKENFISEKSYIIASLLWNKNSFNINNQLLILYIFVYNYEFWRFPNNSSFLLPLSFIRVNEYSQKKLLLFPNVVWRIQNFLLFFLILCHWSHTKMSQSNVIGNLHSPKGQNREMRVLQKGFRLWMPMCWKNWNWRHSQNNYLKIKPKVIWFLLFLHGSYELMKLLNIQKRWNL